MAMSKDRVHFILTDNECNRERCIAAAARAFTLCDATAHELYDTRTTIVCRPSQFARFLIFRSEKVDNNAFAQFKAKLVPRDPPNMYDVSKNLAH